jgi:hypothetical protein
LHLQRELTLPSPVALPDEGVNQPQATHDDQERIRADDPAHQDSSTRSAQPELNGRARLPLTNRDHHIVAAHRPGDSVTLAAQARELRAVRLQASARSRHLNPKAPYKIPGLGARVRRHAKVAEHDAL